jgi:hypothetical protein
MSENTNVTVPDGCATRSINANYPDVRPTGKRRRVDAGD